MEDRQLAFYQADPDSENDKRCKVSGALAARGKREFFWTEAREKRGKVELIR